MKVAWVVDVWPSRTGADDDARQLAQHGHEILVVAGTAVDRAGELAVHELPRADLHREHWQRSASVSVSEAFRALLATAQPDVVHVHHWRSLSRDLVFTGALAGRPAVVSLHDMWTTCLIGTRLLPRTGAACDAPLAVHPCIACAPRTPWVPIEAQYMAFAEHKLQIVRELALARAVLVRDRAHEAAIRRFLGDDAGHLAPFIESSRIAGDASALAEIYVAAAALGAPDVGRARAGDWYTHRMKSFAEAEWERGARASGTPNERQ